jgi:chemotaxis protein CheX
MALIEPIPGKPFVKEDEFAIGTVSAIITISGDAAGTMALSFTDPCIRAIVRGLLGVDDNEVQQYVEDAVGELTNMICGDARARLREEGFSLHAGIPSIIRGERQRIEHSDNGPRLAIPFQTHYGQFMVEVVMSESVQIA